MPLIPCPICGFKLLEIDHDGQVEHMETHHPEEIKRRLTEGGFKVEPDGRITDTKADPDN